jgi:PLP dependent protein
MSHIAANLQHVRDQIRAAETLRPKNIDVTQLVAVSKTQSAAVLREAYAAGQRAFGENYVQESLEKMRELPNLDIEWHFIGPIQSNKAKLIAQNFAWVHGVDRLKIAALLSQHRPTHLAPLQICLQVNVSGEASKSGVSPANALVLAQAVVQLPNLCLRGLMTIIENVSDEAEQRRQFQLLAATMADLKAQIVTVRAPLDTLSMGMSQDFETAISVGSNLVRIGSAIFGARK